MNADELKTQLGQFTGTTQYARLYAHLFLTDGAVFLAEKAKSWWLLDVYAIVSVAKIDAHASDC